MPPMPAPSTGERAGIEMTLPDSIKAEAYANGGLVGPAKYDEYGNFVQPDQAPQLRYQTVGAGRAGDARAILRQGGGFINLDNEPDNQNS